MLKTGQDAGKGLRLARAAAALRAAAAPPRHPGRPHTHLKVAQLYITNPLLMEGRKFHLRLWVLVTGQRPLRAYMHAQGLVLFSSQPYEPGERRRAERGGLLLEPQTRRRTKCGEADSIWPKHAAKPCPLCRIQRTQQTLDHPLPPHAQPPRQQTPNEQTARSRPARGRPPAT